MIKYFLQNRKINPLLICVISKCFSQRMRPDLVADPDCAGCSIDNFICLISFYRFPALSWHEKWCIIIYSARIFQIFQDCFLPYHLLESFDFPVFLSLRDILALTCPRSFNTSPTVNRNRSLIRSPEFIPRTKDTNPLSCSPSNTFSLHLFFPVPDRFNIFHFNFPVLCSYCHNTTTCVSFKAGHPAPNDTNYSLILFSYWFFMILTKDTKDLFCILFVLFCNLRSFYDKNTWETWYWKN